MRVRVAENTTKQPAIVSAACAVINTQSMFRLGSAGLERMLPRPESGLRCNIDSAMGQSPPDGRVGSLFVLRMHSASTFGQRLGRLVARDVERLGDRHWVEWASPREGEVHALDDGRRAGEPNPAFSR